MILKRLDEKDSTDYDIAVDANKTPEVTLGRGPITKITDTKISRNHIKLTFDTQSEKWTLTNLNVKQFYFKKHANQECFETIEKSEAIEVKENFVLGFYQDKLLYEVKNVCKRHQQSTKTENSIEPKKPKVDYKEDSEEKENFNDSKSHNISDDEEENSVPSASKRSSCPYGAECQRKNPQHFREEAHPDDQDYEEIQVKSDLPECEYGLNCYRKNPVHWKEFSHTSRPRKAKAKAKAKKKDDDEYESDFIDDSDTDGADISNDEESVDEWTPDDDE